MPRRDWVLLGAIVAVAALVRFATLDLQSFHHDEAVTAGRIVNPSLFETLDLVVAGERSPPLYYILAWIWSIPFGTGEVGLRSLSALIGTAMVPAGYWAGRELASHRAGLVLAALIALNPYLVWYSQEARSYILLTFFVTVGLGYFAQAIRTGGPRPLAGWAVASALAMASHYFAAFVLAPQVAWLLFARVADRRRVALAVGALAAAVLALAPLAAIQQSGDRRDGFTERSLAGRTATTVLNYVTGERPAPLAGSREVDAVQLGAGAGGALLLAAALIVLRARGSPRERRAAILAGSIGVAAIGVPFALALAGLDFLNPRNLIAAIVPLLAVGAIGFGCLGARRWGLAGAAATLALFAGVLVAINLSEQMQRPNWRGAAEQIGPAAGPRVIVAPQNGDDPLLYYLDAERFLSPRFRDGVRVREIVVLSTTFDVSDPRGFRLVDRQGMAPLFVLWRFESPSPRLVTPEDVRGNRILRERDVALLDGRR